MSRAIDILEAALARAAAGRPKVGGFPYLAETLRRAGVLRNQWCLPSCQSLFLTLEGPVVIQGTPLLLGPADIPPFDREALLAALRRDQGGQRAHNKTPRRRARVAGRARRGTRVEA